MPIRISVIATGKITFGTFHLDHPRTSIGKPACGIRRGNSLFKADHQQSVKITIWAIRHLTLPQVQYFVAMIWPAFHDASAS
jgi:hypothetical protein